MNMRSVKIDLMLNTQSNPITFWFNGFLEKLHIVEANVYGPRDGEFIYYIIANGQKRCIFYQNSNRDITYYDSTYYYTYIVPIVGSAHGFGKQLIQILMNYAIEHNLINGIELIQNNRKPKLFESLTDKVMIKGTLIGDILIGSFVQKF